jgi:hypothetical protein
MAAPFESIMLLNVPLDRDLPDLGMVVEAATIRNMGEAQLLLVVLLAMVDLRTVAAMEVGMEVAVNPAGDMAEEVAGAALGSNSHTAVVTAADIDHVCAQRCGGEMMASC